MSSSFKIWCRNNVFLVAAIVLPVLFVFIFAFARLVPAWTVADPVHALILADYSENYDSPNRFRFSVVDGKLQASYLPRNPNDKIREDWVDLKIYRNGKETEVIRVEPSAAAKTAKESVTLPVPQLDGKRLSGLETAPDGYDFGRNNYRSGSFLVEVFSYRRDYNKAFISKNGRSIAIPGYAGHYDRRQFVGWIVEE